MSRDTNDKEIILGRNLTLDDLVAAARYGAHVSLDTECEKRLKASQKVLRDWVSQGKEVYGVTTGLGSLADCRINEEDAVRMQQNILRSHAVSVGAPLSAEQVRGIMILVVQNLSKGHSGVRKCLLDKYIDLLNSDVIPWTPGSGSVGYLCPEAHIGLVITGEGKAYFKGEPMPAVDAMRAAGIVPLKLEPREALAMISGTTSATAIGALALYDMLTAAASADVIAALNVEVTGGHTEAFDEAVMKARPHKMQAETASNLRNMLKDSRHLHAGEKGCRSQAEGEKLQDPLSARCIPQLHGAAKTVLSNARAVLETEINSCCDNPLIFGGDGGCMDGEGGRIISACNADSSFVGIHMDSACIAATCIAKMSERRTYRLLDGSIPGLPQFLIEKPGINSGFMITQYSQAGLLNEMRILSTPASIDSIPTSAGQEDYVAMGYNASVKAAEAAGKLEYILAIELLTAYQAGMMNRERSSFGSCTVRLLKEIESFVPVVREDTYLQDYIELLKDMIHSGRLIQAAEEAAGPLL